MRREGVIAERRCRCCNCTEYLHSLTACSGGRCACPGLLLDDDDDEEPDTPTVPTPPARDDP
jgi:hypothetical protein